MTNRELEQKIRTAMEHAAPDSLDDILSRCAGDVSAVSQKRSERAEGADSGEHPIRSVLSRLTIASPAPCRIILDVNPSVYLEVDDDEKVIDARALNDDGEGLLKGMDLAGLALYDAVESIVEAMISKGYLSEIQNSILVSVDNSDPERGIDLQNKISRIIEEVVDEDLADSDEGASVISQEVDETDDELVALSKKYGISVGKAALIRKMVGQTQEEKSMDENTDKDSGELRFEDLAPMTVNDIALLADENKMKDDTVTRIGHASEKGYIGHKGALEAALKYAGIKLHGVYKQKVKMSCSKGLMVYKVKLKTSSGKYKYYLDARTGAMMRCKKNGKKGKKIKMSKKKYYYNTYTGNYAVPNAQTGPIPEGVIGEEAAKKAALADAGINESDTLYIYCHPEWDHGYMEHYDVKFVAGGLKYKYAIGIYDGTVLGRAVKDKRTNGKYIYEGNYHEHYSSAAVNTPTPAPSAAPTVASSPAAENESIYDDVAGNMIDEDKAVSIAMDKFGLTQNDLRKCSVRIKTKHGRMVYRVKLKSGGVEYECNVDCYSATVTKARKEIDY